MSAATDRNKVAMKKINARDKAKANNMKKGTVGSALKKSISAGMNSKHRVG